MTLVHFVYRVMQFLITNKNGIFILPTYAIYKEERKVVENKVLIVIQ